MNPEIFYYLWVTLLLVCNCAALAANLFTLPGNWMVVGLAVLFALFVAGPDGQSIGWVVIAVATGLAVLGELVEFAAGAAGAAKYGASRRAMLLALGGTVVGSLAGAVIFTAILPIVGTIIGALGGGAFGAFVGAYFGEMWKGRTAEESLAVGKGALLGRLLGTVGKLAIGAVIVVIVTIDSFS